MGVGVRSVWLMEVELGVRLKGFIVALVRSAGEAGAPSLRIDGEDEDKGGMIVVVAGVPSESRCIV